CLARVKLLHEYRAQIVGADRWQMIRLHLAALAINERKDHLLAPCRPDMLTVALAAVPIFLFPADVGFVSLNDTARAEYAAGLFHRFAQAVRHEPRRFIGHAKHALDLFAADALFARGHQRRGQQPFIEANLGALEHGAHRYRELVAAMAAVVHAGAVRLALKLADAVYRAAMRAH